LGKLFSVLSLFICLVLAACGGDNNTPTAAPAPATATTGSASVPATAATPPASATVAMTGTSGTTTSACANPTHVVLATGFTPNVGNAPYYIAMAKGYYTANCLNVEIKYGQVTNVYQLVSDGQIQFVLVTGDTLIPARLKGVNIKYIMATNQKYPVGALALANSGFSLKSPADLKGHSVGYSAAGSSTYVGMEAMLKAANLTDNDIKPIQIGFNEVEALTSKRVDIAFTFLSNEAVQMRALGYQVQTLQLPNTANLISSGVAAGDKLIQEHPEMVQAFVSATAHGLKDALADPSGAFDISLKQLGDLSPDKIPVQRDVMTATLDYMQPPSGGHPLGWSDPAGWQATQNLLQATGIISGTADPTTFYTNQFAEAAKP